ncbi:MAG TPA: MFS transporter, partial [Candidatus Caenarcaniphilales bacterium]
MDQDRDVPLRQPQLDADQAALPQWDAPPLNQAPGSTQESFQEVPAPEQRQPEADQGEPNQAECLETPQPAELTANLGQPESEPISQPEIPQAESMTQGFLSVFKNRSFLTLWSGQVFSQLADKVYLVLMIAIITSRFQAAGQTVSGWVSSIMVASTIPAVLFGSLAGVFVDRWSKQKVLVMTNLLRGGLVLILPFLLWICQGWGTLGGIPLSFCVLLVVTFLVSTLTQFFAPAEQAAIPLIVERRYLLSANSLYTLTMMASVIVGFAVGEPILALADTLALKLGGGAGIGKELLVGGNYAIAGLLLLLLKTGERAALPTPSASHVWQDIRDGLRYLKQQKNVRCALIQLIILFSVFAALAV